MHFWVVYAFKLLLASLHSIESIEKLIHEYSFGKKCIIHIEILIVHDQSLALGVLDVMVTKICLVFAQQKIDEDIGEGC